MPLRKRSPLKPSAAPPFTTTKCPYCTASRTAEKHDSALNRLRRFFTRRKPSLQMPSLCHMCGIGGELMMDFKQVYYVASISSANCKQFMESMDENRNEDVASDTNVLLHGIGEETCVRRPEGLDSGSVEEWVSDQQAIVERMRRRLRYILRGKRWSRKKLVPRKPGRRPPVIFISSAPCGLATISEDKELKFPVRRRTAIE